MSLAEYERKRHFGRTREPAPGRSARARPIFVVQLHHASHRHYDFRLQVGDALKSWAVPKGPSLDPSVKRLAAEVEDHPIAYAAFEGEIPEGEYGAGHVALFDRGLWATAEDPEAQLAKGHLRFELFGDKLKGGWHLVRTHRASARPQWLLFKEDDDYAAPREADDMLDDVAAPTAGNRRRRGARAEGAGKARRTAKKTASRSRTPAASRATARAKKQDWQARALALSGARRARLADGPFKPQLAILGTAPPPGDDWLHEAKWDGYRLLTVIRDGEVRIWSRNALEWTAKVPEIAGALAQLGLEQAALDGELIAGAGTQADFSVLQATLAGEKNAPLSYVLFDLLHLEGVDISRATQLERKDLLATLLKRVRPPLAYSSHVLGHGERAFAAAAERHLEGIISKRASAPYRAGRGDDWRKSKRQESDEFAVVGMTPPRGSRTGFGSLLLARPDGRGGWSFAGRVGTGFNQAMLAELGETLGRRVRATPTVDIPDALDTDLRGARWFPPKAVVEVFYRGVGNQGLLRQPSLKGLRPDKTAADLRSSERSAPERSKRMVKPRGKAAGRRGAPADDDAIELTHPGRVVYPDIGATKQDVADYYDTVMEWLLPEIDGRPLSIIRCPQGSTRPCFFQKHLAPGMQYVDSVPLKEESGQTEDYLVVHDARAVRELVQFNALEFHPWGAQAKDPDVADRVVFDLDPGPDVPWSGIVAAARQMRGLLEDAGLQSFVRTSGGKGLHLVVPLNPGCDWDLVKPFAHAFAESMARMDPLKFVATSSKRLRKGRIFIDYLRNGRGATSVASFSLRARPGAPVAMPLRWEELGRVKSGNAFDITSTPARLRRLKQHPWAGIERIRQNLAKLAPGEG